MKRLTPKTSIASHVTAKSFFEGNEYYLFVYETYRDVRLVGTPPESIGKFGGDTDNWMWPRHTGDFTFMRAYVAPDGSAAKYSEDNIPYTPKKHPKLMQRVFQKVTLLSYLVIQEELIDITHHSF